MNEHTIQSLPKRLRLMFVGVAMLAIVVVAALVYAVWQSGQDEPVPDETPTADVAAAESVTPSEEDRKEEGVVPLPGVGPGHGAKPAGKSGDTPGVVVAEDEPSDEPPPPEPEVEERDKKKREKMIRKAVDGILKELALTDEQREEAKETVEALEGLVRGALEMMGPIREATLEARRIADEKGMTRDERKAFLDQERQRIMLANRDTMMTLLDDVATSMDEFRPHLEPEQVGKLDKILQKLKKEQQRVYGGNVK